MGEYDKINAVLGMMFAVMLSFLTAWALTGAENFAVAVDYPSFEFTTVVFLFLSSITAVAAMGGNLRRGDDRTGGLVLIGVSAIGFGFYCVWVVMYLVCMSGDNCKNSAICNSNYDPLNIPASVLIHKRDPTLYIVDAIAIGGGILQAGMVVLTIMSHVNSRYAPAASKLDPDAPLHPGGIVSTGAIIWGVFGIIIGVMTAVAYSLSVVSTLAFPGPVLPTFDSHTFLFVVFASYAIIGWLPIAAVVYNSTSPNSDGFLRVIAVLVAVIGTICSWALFVVLCYYWLSGHCGGDSGTVVVGVYTPPTTTGESWCTEYHVNGVAAGDSTVASVFVLHFISVLSYSVLVTLSLIFASGRAI